MADDTSSSELSSPESVTTFLVFRGDIAWDFFFRGDTPFCAGFREDVDRLEGGEEPGTKRVFLDGLPFAACVLGRDSGGLGLGVAASLDRSELFDGEDGMGIRDGFVGDRRSSSSEASEADA